MPRTNKPIRDQIADYCLQQLKTHPDGLRFSELKRLVVEKFKGTPDGTIHGSVYVLGDHPQVVKPSRGLFRLREYDITKEAKKPKSKIKEQDFYGPFANWITTELEECTKALEVGGNKFKDKWGTPDVVGIKRPKESDMLKFPIEIVSAEIKVDGNGLITAFGQACAYRLFSHRSYIVVPRQSRQDDIDRLDSLALVFGIGLILFDNTNKLDPQFEIRSRAARHEPDMFYANKYMKLLENDLFS
ncbi:MAG: hypothetical protein QY325_13660 [Flavobacteriales bacterium]|nr:MAG: hypothetical protein QY325_13660 [Flavobacteriales bacterium]